MIPVLKQWNRWGGATLASWFPRDIVEKVGSFLDTKERVTFVGLRQAGKTSILY